MATIEKPNDRVTVPYAPKSTSAATSDDERAPQGAGWVLFSAIVLGLIGVFSFVDGILAISSSKVFTANATYVFSDLRTWGWIVAILGALSVVASLMLFAGSEFARWYGITIAALTGLGQLMFVHANPWWSVSMFAISIAVIYGLAAYAGSRLRLG